MGKRHHGVLRVQRLRTNPFALCVSPCHISNVSQDDRFGVPPGRRVFAEGSAQSRLALTRQISRTVVDLLVQLCGGDGGAVLIGMMSQAFPAGIDYLFGRKMATISSWGSAAMWVARDTAAVVRCGPEDVDFILLLRTDSECVKVLRQVEGPKMQLVSQARCVSRQHGRGVDSFEATGSTNDLASDAGEYRA